VDYQITLVFKHNFMKESIRILFLEDDLNDSELIIRALLKGNINFIKRLVDNHEDFIAEINNFNPELIISDYFLPGFDGMSALKIRNEVAPDLPFILVTGSVNEEVALECMKAGADDYVFKQHLSRLSTAVRSSLWKKEILMKKAAAEQALHTHEAKISSIFRVLPAGIGVTNNRILMEVNPYFCQMVGYTSEELIGKSAELLYPTFEDYKYVGEEKYRQIDESGKGKVETQWKRKDGNIIDIVLVSTPINQNDLSQGITFTALDITEMKRTEKTLLEKIEELEHFNDITIGRELKMIELKREINSLLKQLGEKEKYNLVE